MKVKNLFLRLTQSLGIFLCRRMVATCLSGSGKQENPIYFKKHYFINNGLLNIFMLDNHTALLENLCTEASYRKSFKDERYGPFFYNKEVELDILKDQYSGMLFTS